jgi:hypothetical protein
MEESSVRRTLLYRGLFHTEESSVRKSLPYGRVFRAEDEADSGVSGPVVVGVQEILHGLNVRRDRCHPGSSLVFVFREPSQSTAQLLSHGSRVRKQFRRLVLFLHSVTKLSLKFPAVDIAQESKAYHWSNHFVAPLFIVQRCSMMAVVEPACDAGQSCGFHATGR